MVENVDQWRSQPITFLGGQKLGRQKFWF